MSPLPQEMCRGRGAWNPGQSRALEKLQLPGGPISQTGHICPFLSAVCSDSGVHTGPSGQGPGQKLGTRGCPGAAAGAGFSLSLTCRKNLAIPQ